MNTETKSINNTSAFDMLLSDLQLTPGYGVRLSDTKLSTLVETNEIWRSLSTAANILFNGKLSANSDLSSYNFKDNTFAALTGNGLSLSAFVIIPARYDEGGYTKNKLTADGADLDPYIVALSVNTNGDFITSANIKRINHDKRDYRTQVFKDHAMSMRSFDTDTPIELSKFYTEMPYLKYGLSAAAEQI